MKQFDNMDMHDLYSGNDAKSYTVHEVDKDNFYNILDVNGNFIPKPRPKVGFDLSKRRP